MRRRDKTEVYIDCLAGFVRRATDRVRPPFFAVARSEVQSPASIKIRFTVFGLSNGSQRFALASSSAIRRLPHLGFLVAQVNHALLNVRLSARRLFGCVALAVF